MQPKSKRTIKLDTKNFEIDYVPDKLLFILYKQTDLFIAYHTKTKESQIVFWCIGEKKSKSAIQTDIYVL